MPSPTALIDPQLCHPDLCPEGKCQAAALCDRKVLKQEAPHEVPYVTSLCRGCMKCHAACPAKAIIKA